MKKDKKIFLIVGSEGDDNIKKNKEFFYNINLQLRNKIKHYEKG